MYEFAPGSQKTAIVPMTNPGGKAFDYDAMLYMGVNMVAMSGASFALQSGEEKEISLPVTMPLEIGVYPVFLDVFSGGALLGHYQAVNDVAIAASEATLHSLEYTVYPCYKGRATVQALVYIPTGICPAGTKLRIEFCIPKDSDALPPYNPGNLDQQYTNDWDLIKVEIPSEDLTSPNGLYTITALRELNIYRYRSSPAPQSYYDFLPARAYPLYFRVSHLTPNGGWFSPWDVEVLSNVQLADFVISSQVMSSFTYSHLNTWKEDEGTRVRAYFEARVTNSGHTTETHCVRLFTRRSQDGWSWRPSRTSDLTLAPGQYAIVGMDNLTMAGTGRYFQCTDDQGSESAIAYQQC